MSDGPAVAIAARPVVSDPTPVPASATRTVRGRVIATALAGAFTGLVVGGIGGRLAMLLLRLTSDDSVRGVMSDDGFEIGRVTLAGTLGLFVIGTMAGVLGAFVHRLVAPWLIGPAWFRRLTTATGCAVVVGAILIEKEGVDFTLLEPHWLAVALFMFVPGLFGALIGPVQAHFDRPGSWVNRGRFRRWLPALFVGPFAPFAGIIMGVAFAVGLLGAELRAQPAFRRAVASPPVRVLARVPWLLIVALGLADLIPDIGAIV